jgi:hypothetical protein
MGLSLRRSVGLLSRKPVRLYAFRVLAVICALHVSGAHWLALQAVAWTGMLVARTQQGSVQEAVRTTFDGDHPCPLCHVVEEGRRQQQEQDPVQILEQLAKLNFLKPQPIFLPQPTMAGFLYPGTMELGISRGETPPTPPPRLA